jgi:hypothetical protein
MRRPSSSAAAGVDQVCSTDLAGLSSLWIASARAASASRSDRRVEREISTWPTFAAGGVPASQPASALRATSETRRATRRRTREGCYVVPGPPQSSRGGAGATTIVTRWCRGHHNRHEVVPGPP